MGRSRWWEDDFPNIENRAPLPVKWSNVEQTHLTGYSSDRSGKAVHTFSRRPLW